MLCMASRSRRAHVSQRRSLQLYGSTSVHLSSDAHGYDLLSLGMFILRITALYNERRLSVVATTMRILYVVLYITVMSLSIYQWYLVRREFPPNHFRTMLIHLPVSDAFHWEPFLKVCYLDVINNSWAQRYTASVWALLVRAL